GIVVLSGVGLLVASASAGVAAAAGKGVAFHTLSLVINTFVLFWLFVVLLKVSLPRPLPFKNIRLGCAVAAVGLVVLQAFGGYLLTRQLKNLDALYSNFAIPLGLLFWIYLQAQVVYYAVEVAAVHRMHLWPRSLSGRLTLVDKRVYAR